MRFLFVALISISFMGFSVHAEDIDFGLDETLASMDEANKEVVSQAESETRDIKSELIKELHLTPAQRDKAKHLSDENRIKLEQIIGEIDSLQQKAREIEEKSLDDFADILTDEQKVKFYEFKSLRNEEKKTNNGEIEDILAPFNE